MPAPRLHRQFHEAFEAATITVEELWLRYFSLGGEAGLYELDAYLNGALDLPSAQHDILAHAINERLDEIAPPRAPYSDDFTEGDDFTEADDAGDGPENDS
jgi:hypothetical protein